MSFSKNRFMAFFEKYPNLTTAIPWILNFLAISYFGYVSWWASVDFNGFTSMLFGIPTLFFLLLLAYFVGNISENKSYFLCSPTLATRIICVGLLLFYLSGFFPSLKVVSEMPTKVATRLSEMITGKSPDQWVRPIKNSSY